MFIFILCGVWKRKYVQNREREKTWRHRTHSRDIFKSAIYNMFGFFFIFFCLFLFVMMWSWKNVILLGIWTFFFSYARHSLSLSSHTYIVYYAGEQQKIAQNDLLTLIYSILEGDRKIDKEKYSDDCFLRWFNSFSFPLEKFLFWIISFWNEHLAYFLLEIKQTCLNMS